MNTEPEKNRSPIHITPKSEKMRKQQTAKQQKKGQWESLLKRGTLKRKPATKQMLLGTEEGVIN